MASPVTSQVVVTQDTFKATPEQRTMALEFYRAARAEIVQRLATREQILLAALAFSGVIAGVVVKGDVKSSQLSLLIPYFVAPFTLAHLRHTRIIEMLDDYLRFEISPVLGVPSKEPTKEDWNKLWRYDKSPDGVRPWDESVVIRQRMPKYMNSEGFVNCALLCGPALVVLLWQFFTLHNVGWAVWIGAVLTLFALTLLIRNWKQMSHLYWKR